MSSEKSRQSSVLKIHKKDDKSTFVRLKIIGEITFVDPADQYQESVYKFDNSHNSSREVDIVDVDGLQVERVKKFNMKDAVSDGQEILYSLLTNANAHKTTHTTKIYKYENGAKDESTWIKVERIDELRVVDPTDQYQESVYKLNWPDLEIADWDNDESGGEFCEFPIRLDPFQNIIEANLGNVRMVIKAYSAGATGWGDMQFEHDPGDYDLYINKKFVMSVNAGQWNGFDGNVTGSFWFGFINAEKVFGKNIFTDPYPGGGKQYFHILTPGALGLIDGRSARIELRQTRAPVFSSFPYLKPQPKPFIWVSVWIYLFKDENLNAADFDNAGTNLERTEKINFGWGLDTVDLEGTTPGGKGTIGGFSYNFILKWPKA